MDSTIQLKFNLESIQIGKKQVDQLVEVILIEKDTGKAISHKGE